MISVKLVLHETVDKEQARNAYIALSLKFKWSYDPIYYWLNLFHEM